MARRLLFLNGLAIIGAVLNHTIGWGYVAMFYWTHRYMPVSSPNFDQLGNLTYYALRVGEQAIISAIPVFLFVSGFFVAFATRKSQPTVDWKFIGTRIRYLAIPYLVWSIIMLAVEAVQGEIYSPVGYARRILLGETTPAFYFVPLLIQLYLLARFIVPLARERWKLLLIGTFVIQAAAHIVRYYQITNTPLPAADVAQVFAAGWFFAGNLFWFCLGMVFGFHQAAFRALLARIRWPLVASAVVLFVVGIVEWEALLRSSGQEWITPKETLLDNFLSLAFLLAFLSFELPKSSFVHALEELGSRSFGIYLVHSLVLIFMARAIYHFAPWMLGMQFIFQPLLLAGGLGFPLLLMELVKRSPARKIYAYQFG
jgi:membrane-bound acyltransferase YfiQ involved in biofilm formation